MKKALFLITLLFLLTGFLVFEVFLSGSVIAEADDNVTGFAWSENIGWISLNCDNLELSQPRCQNSDYGVHIDASGNFSGDAWSDNIGWIDFAPSGPYPENPQYSVRVDTADGQVTGWVRALVSGGGWDGWIKMYNTAINTGTGDFSGWAWGSDIMGWINFSGVSYKVNTSFSFNGDPSVSNLSVDQGDYCVLAFRPRFYWDFNDVDVDDFQNSYQVQIDDDIDIGASPLIDSCVPSPGTCDNGYTAESYAPTSPSSFDYNKTYYWRVRVWDNNGGVSNWAQGQFSTPIHGYPEPDFIWIPLRPSIGEFAQFCATEQGGLCISDESDCYNILGNKISCSGNTFVWTFPAGSEFSTTTSASSENPKVKIAATDWQVVSLRINDGVGNCSVNKNIRISAPLPTWRETAP